MRPLISDNINREHIMWLVLTRTVLVTGFEFDDEVRVLPHHVHDALLDLERQLREFRVAFSGGFVITTDLTKRNCLEKIVKDFSNIH